MKGDNNREFGVRRLILMQVDMEHFYKQVKNMHSKMEMQQYANAILIKAKMHQL